MIVEATAIAPLRPADGGSDCGSHFARWFPRLGRLQSLGHVGDIAIDGVQPIGPVAAEPGVFAYGEIEDVNRFCRLGPHRPDLPGATISFERFLQSRAVARALVDAIQNSGAQFGSEKAARHRLRSGIVINPEKRYVARLLEPAGAFCQ